MQIPNPPVVLVNRRLFLNHAAFLKGKYLDRLVRRRSDHGFLVKTDLAVYYDAIMKSLFLDHFDLLLVFERCEDDVAAGISENQVLAVAG